MYIVLSHLHWQRKKRPFFFISFPVLWKKPWYDCKTVDLYIPSHYKPFSLVAFLTFIASFHCLECKELDISPGCRPDARLVDSPVTVFRLFPQYSCETAGPARLLFSRLRSGSRSRATSSSHESISREHHHKPTFSPRGTNSDVSTSLAWCLSFKCWPENGRFLPSSFFYQNTSHHLYLKKSILNVDFESDKYI